MSYKRYGLFIVILVLIVALALSACGGGDRSSGGGGKGGAKGKEKITICHKTDDVSRPFLELSIPESAAKGHSKHEGDIIPAPEGGCP